LVISRPNKTKEEKEFIENRAKKRKQPRPRREKSQERKNGCKKGGRNLELKKREQPSAKMGKVYQ